MTHSSNPDRSKKKKVDYEALQSPLKRIPGIDLPGVRDLLDLGFKQVDELRGRAPEALFSAICKRRASTPRDRLWTFRMAVYFAETEDPEPEKMHPWAWKD